MAAPSLPIVIRDDIKQALLHNRAVVALESTIISHGMSFSVESTTAVAAVAQGYCEPIPGTVRSHTIVFAGMPYPQNLDTAKRVEAVLQQHGALPATIALMHGKVCIGLDSAQLQQLASQGPKFTKVSRRDILPVLASQSFGATTVAATMLLAHAAGIRVFVTGGIGGVHRGVQDTMDISADLTELGRTPVAVVCAGVKSVRTPKRTIRRSTTTIVNRSSS